MKTVKGEEAWICFPGMRTGRKGGFFPAGRENSKGGFIFVDDKNLRATLLEDIDESQLPEIYGGMLNLAAH
ncbi:hypothetical protein KSP40_PGU001168 [Platanthera guangdongensis]|uniref:Uncharacterized protein n=1 Tax=Platanthera guangdongensis TaxID=2320717 RepID=A0ABR2MG81_9ASPA